MQGLTHDLRCAVRVPPLDWPTYGAVVVALAMVGLLASVVPACRAARVDPAATLRGE